MVGIYCILNSFILFIILMGLHAEEASAYVTGCYYTNWAQYRPDKGKYTPDNYELGLCSHIFYAFAIMNPDFTLKMFEWNDDVNYKKINDIKSRQPGLKTLLSFGGYTFSEGNKNLLKSMASSQENRHKFIESALSFVKKYNFDGLDMDWEYPEAADKSTFADLIKELAEKFHAENLLLSAAVTGSPTKIDEGYDVPALAESLDLINIMSYDFHGSGWEKETGFNSPLYDRNGDKLSMKTAADYWASKGMPKSKIIVGLATYGRSWTLANIEQHGVGAAGSIGKAGPNTKEPGMLAYYEIADILKSGGNRNFDDGQKVPYVVNGDQWIGYDDKESFQIKLDWIKTSGFGGAFIWTLDMDDFSGSQSGGEKYPLMKIVKEALAGGNPEIKEKEKESTTTIEHKKTTNKAKTATTTGPHTKGSFACAEPGIFANTASCTNFYNCDAGLVAHLTECPAGLHFNKDTKNCDWPANVKC